MKIIDLLVKIANDEEVPKIIKYRNEIYQICNEAYKYDYKNENGCMIEDNINSYIFDNYVLNENIEIIEDKPKKIEKINLFDNFTGFEDNPITRQLSANFQEINEKFDDLIEQVNYLLEKSDKE